MKFLKRLAIAFAILLAIVVAAPFFIPVGSYIPQIEKLVAEKLKEPVKIAALKVAILPLPHATLEGVTVGKAPDIDIQAITVTPDVFSLFDTVKIIKSIEVEGATVKQAAFAKMPDWIKSDGTPAQVRIGRLLIRAARMELKKSVFGPFDAEVLLDQDGGLDKALITSADGKLRATVTPVKKNFAIDISAKDWQLPVGSSGGPPLKFAQLNARGEAGATYLNFPEINGSLYGGNFKGAAILNWKSAWQLKGEMNAAKIDLQSLAPVLNPDIKVSGKLDAKSNFSSHANTAGQLADALRLESVFQVYQGVLYNVDIAQAAQSFLKGGSKGGETRFDVISGHLLMDAAGHHFRDLKISSGTLAASGKLDISPKQQLQGRITAELKVGISLVAVPLDVSGSVKEPVLFPTKGAMAGAAAGTALLGPAGTALGVKAGSALEKLLGKKPAASK